MKKAISFILFNCILINCFGEKIFVAGYSNTNNSPEDDDDKILSERIVKSPWNVDKLSPDDIRCYCNLPVCITTSYMCRTARKTAGGCFSEILETSENPEIARHGCVELLPDDAKCDNLPRKHEKHSGQSTLILCCQDDMCNHMDNHKKLILNFTTENDDRAKQQKNRTNRYEHGPKNLPQQPKYQDTIDPEYNDSKEFWFKIATILVPVLGAIILFMLIALAIRMLKNDSSFDSSSKLGSPNMGTRKIALDFEANYNQAPLIKPNSLLDGQSYSHHPPGYTPTHNIDKKNETQAKINQLMHLEYTLLPQSCHDPSVKLTNTDVNNDRMYRNVNLSLQQNRCRNGNDKVYEKETLNPVTVNWVGSGNGGGSSGGNTNANFSGSSSSNASSSHPGGQLGSYGM